MDAVFQVAGSHVPGTQVVGRIAAVLRAVSQAMPAGIVTTTIGEQAGIARPTAHRLLSSLAAHGFIDRDASSGNWLLGPEMYLMGHVAADRYDITEIAREHVAALAAATGESAFLSARRGNETVCILREDGSFPIRSFVLYEGKRFPLGVASAGLAILSYLPPEMVDRYLASVALVDEYGGDHDAQAIRARIEATRRTGYAVNPAQRAAVLGAQSHGCRVAICPRTAPRARPPLTRTRSPTDPASRAAVRATPVGCVHGTDTLTARNSDEHGRTLGSRRS